MGAKRPKSLVNIKIPWDSVNSVILTTILIGQAEILKIVDSLNIFEMMYRSPKKNSDRQ